MYDCACAIFIHVGKDLQCKRLFITLECDVMSSHTWGGEGREAVTDCSSCLKLCTKLSDQTSCFDLKKKKVHCFLVPPFDEMLPFDGPFDVNRCFLGQNLRTNFKLKTFHFCNLF